MQKIKKLFRKLFGKKNNVTIIGSRKEFDEIFPDIKIKYSNIKNSRIIIKGKTIIDNRYEKNNKLHNNNNDKQTNKGND